MSLTYTLHPLHSDLNNVVELAVVVFNHQHVNAIHLHRQMAVNIVLEIVFAIVRATPKIVPVTV